MLKFAGCSMLPNFTVYISVGKLAWWRYLLVGALLHMRRWWHRSELGPFHTPLNHIRHRYGTVVIMTGFF